MFGPKLLILSFAAGLPAPAMASQAAPQAELQLARDQYRAAFRLVGCASRQSPSAPRKLLETEIASDEEARQVNRMRAVGRRCAGDFPPFSPLVVRSVAAIMLYNAEFRRVEPRLPVDPVLPASFAVVPADRQGSEAQKDIWYVAGIANCISYVNPKLAREAVLADPDPRAEEESFRALKPALDRCLRPGSAFPIAPMQFRGILAEQLLKRSRAAGHAPESGN